MRKNLKAKTLESLSSVLPITALVLLLSFTLAPDMPVGTLMMFLLGAILLVVGMGLFSLGADMAMMPMGDSVGGEVVRLGKRSVWPILPIVFLIGAFITMAEPDLQVLANQVPAVPDMVIILTVAAGVGVFLVISVVNTLKEKFSLNSLLLFFYILVFLLAFIVPGEFLAVAFDSGGVTTGPITVPFIMALGIGVASTHSDGQKAEDNSFGMVALCSIGPILAGADYGHLPAGHGNLLHPLHHHRTPTPPGRLAPQFLHGFPEYMQEVAVAPAARGGVLRAVPNLFPAFAQKTPLIRLLVGIALHLCGAGAVPHRRERGLYARRQLPGQPPSPQLPYNWILIPIGMVVGYFIVAAEPAVHVLNKQVEEVTGGAIPQRAMNLSLSIGVAVSVGLAMTRVLTGISILWFLVPGYAIALILSRKVPKIFTAIAFDSGGVASGPMTATFLLPFAMGACSALGGNVLTDAFGIVAMVAMTPLVTIQCLGAFYQRKLRRTVEVTAAEISTMSSEDIIEFDDV